MIVVATKLSMWFQIMSVAKITKAFEFLQGRHLINIELWGRLEIVNYSIRRENLEGNVCRNISGRGIKFLFLVARCPTLAAFCWTSYSVERNSV